MMKRAYWDHEKLRDYQNEKLRRIVKYAFENSRFYNEKFKEADVKPEDVRTVEDLNKLPIVRKSELRTRASQDVVSSEFDMADLMVQRTSGSTGQPLYIYITGRENEFRKAKHLRAQMALGQKPWDKWVTITSPLHFAETTKLQRMLGLYGISAVSVFDDLATQVSKIEKLKPDVIDGYSNSLFLLAREVKRRGLDTIRPKFLVSGAELIDVNSRKFVEEVFGVPFYDQYACVELERMAWQCKEKDGYHIDADSVIMQFVDKNGEEVSPSEEGEVVCTSLFNYAMPFVRYALDDIGVPSEKTQCECGRTFPLMKVMEGRKTALLTLPSGRVLAPFAFMLAVWTFKHYGCIDLFRIVQKKKDLLVFRLKVKECAADRSVIEKELLAHMRNVLNISEDEMAFEVDFVDDIPLDKSGKFSIVVSELNQANQ
jgi:phenylacetate-CoA ligase